MSLQAKSQHNPGAMEPCEDSDAPGRGKGQKATTIRETDRHLHLATLAGMLHGTGLSSAAISAALAAENSAKCQPPVDASQLNRIVASVTKDVAAARGDSGEMLLEVVLEHFFAGGKHLT